MTRDVHGLTRKLHACQEELESIAREYALVTEFSGVKHTVESCARALHDACGQLEKGPEPIALFQEAETGTIHEKIARVKAGVKRVLAERKDT